MEGERRTNRLAATRVASGTDVNFGALTRALVDSLAKKPGVSVHLGHEICALRRDGDAWSLDVRNVKTGATRTVRARFVFIGAGGYSLKLLEQSGIPECAGYGAFPVSGQWLRCTNRNVIERHHAKVYGKAEVGAPPMSVPHLDSRWIDGEKQLLFGPYAGFTTRFLKQGSWLDLLGSIGVSNLLPVMSAGVENLELTQYLVGQAMLTEEERLMLLRRYYPTAREDDWEVQVAGLRVQIIKADARGRGELKFGTEIVTSADGSIAALLGASPGASTAVAESCSSSSTAASPAASNHATPSRMECGLCDSGQRVTASASDRPMVLAPARTLLKGSPMLRRTWLTLLLALSVTPLTGCMTAAAEGEDDEALEDDTNLAREAEALTVNTTEWAFLDRINAARRARVSTR